MNSTNTEEKTSTNIKEPNTYEITLNTPWFFYTKIGIKKYEGRCYWKSVKEYKPGDILRISHHTDNRYKPFNTKIVNIHRFKTFEEALTKLPIEEILPTPDEPCTIKEGVDIYLQFYKLQTQLDNGVCMLELELE